MTAGAIGEAAYDCRAGTTVHEMAVERVKDAEREARPDRGAEIKRHPGNLVLPLGKVSRHDPARAHVTQALKRSQELAAIGGFCTPSAQIHRDIDSREKNEIAGNADDRDDE